MGRVEKRTAEPGREVAAEVLVDDDPAVEGLVRCPARSLSACESESDVCCCCKKIKPDELQYPRGGFIKPGTSTLVQLYTAGGNPQYLNKALKRFSQC